MELVGVLPGVRDQVQLGHHQHLAVVVVHSFQSGTFKYKSLAGVVCSKSHVKNCLAIVWAEGKNMWSCSFLTSLCKRWCSKMSRPRISWWRLWSMRNELLKDQEPMKCQSESKKVKYKPKTQRKLGTRLTPGMERQRTRCPVATGIKRNESCPVATLERQRRTTKPEIFPLKVFEEHVSKRVLECKEMLSKTV